METTTAGLVFGYARVSTGDQVHDRQLDALRDAGVPEEHVVTDTTSGAVASRPGLDGLMQRLRSGDTVVIAALDRLGRDTRQLLAWVDELSERGVGLRILNLGVDSQTPAGRLVLTVIAALAAMEREVLVERTKQGIAAARARGRIGGRPPALSEAQRREVQRLHGKGRPSGELAALFGCSPRTIRRVTAAGTP